MIPAPPIRGLGLAARACACVACFNRSGMATTEARAVSLMTIDAVVGQRRNDDVDRLRQDDIGHHLPPGQPQRRRGFELPFGDGLDAGAEDFGRIGA